LQPPFGDEGRAMLQIVHDVAPGAALAFYTAENGEADFATGIGKLATAGAKVIADDVGFFDEPFFQEGLIAQAVDAVEASGVVYFSAAGNDGDAAYDNLAPAFSTAAVASGDNAGEYLLNFDTSGVTTTTTLPITIDAMQPGELVAVVVEWDQPFVTGAAASGGATSRIDICISGATSQYTILNSDNDAVTCTGANAAGADPVQILIIANPASATTNTPKETLNLTIGLADGTAAPGRIKVAVESDGQSDAPITTFATHSATLQGHPGASGAAAVGAAFYFDTPACGTNPATIEPYSSLGGAPILFDATGTRLATPIYRQRPNFVAPDGGNDTFLGFTLAKGGYTGTNGQLSTTIAGCQNDASYPNFFGTSAATPHVASIAALMLQANPALTPTQVVDALQSSALSMNGTAAPDYLTGYGFVQANAAFAMLPAVAPPAPSLAVASSSIVVGKSTTLTWSSANATSCSASGSWSGTQATSGTLTVSGSAVGTLTYELTCSNATGSSPAATASVSVTAAPASGGHSGGGTTNPWQIALLSALAAGAARLRRTRKQPAA
jgi:subtilisin family serine protease